MGRTRLTGPTMCYGDRRMEIPLDEISNYLFTKARIENREYQPREFIEKITEVSLNEIANEKYTEAKLKSLKDILIWNVNLCKTVTIKNLNPDSKTLEKSVNISPREIYVSPLQERNFNFYKNL